MNALAHSLGINTDRSGQTTWGKVNLEALARAHGTPLYVYNADLLHAQWNALQRGLQGLRTQVFFAAKANSSGGILRMLAGLGAGADIVSGGELYRARLAGIAPERIVFSGVGKTDAEIREALLCGPTGIKSFHVESAAELAVIEKLAQECGRTARVSLRLNPDVNARTHPYISTGLKKNKFGLSARQVVELCSQYRNSLAVQIGGLSIHIGSQILTLAPLREAFMELKRVRKLCETALGRPLQWLDLGGGLGIRYDREKAPSIEQYTALIHKMFGAEKNLEILLEPGRLLLASCGLLLTQVLFRKNASLQKARDFLIVDAAMTELLRPALYGSYHHILPVGYSETEIKKALRLTDVVGPVCETADFLAQERKLPADLDRGDLLAVLCTGAYGISMASQYNSRPLAAEVLIEHGTTRLLRKRQSHADLVREEISS